MYVAVPQSVRRWRKPWWVPGWIECFCAVLVPAGIWAVWFLTTKPLEKWNWSMVIDAAVVATVLSFFFTWLFNRGDRPL